MFWNLAKNLNVSKYETHLKGRWENKQNFQKLELEVLYGYQTRLTEVVFGPQFQVGGVFVQLTHHPKHSLKLFHLN